MVIAVTQSFKKTHRSTAFINGALRSTAIAPPGLLQHLWWHTKAYSVSTVLLLLLGVSLVVLRLHSFYRNGFKRARLSGNAHTSVNAHYD